MSPAPSPQSFPGPEPFTPTSDFDTASFASLFSTKSENMNNPPSSIDAARSSMLASMSSQMGKSLSSTQSTTLATVATPTSTGPPTTTPTPASGASASNPVSTHSATGTAPGTAPNAASSTASAAAGSTSPVASSAANNATNNLRKESGGGMSSPGMQAAVAVPVVVIVLAAIALVFFCMRRRKKRAAAEAHGKIEKTPPARRKKKWTRHLRVFSFDAELLMGGRYSSTNSIRSRQTGSIRSAARSRHSDSPSLHSIDEVAPPYRDAVSAAHPPNIASVMAAGGPMAGGVAAAGTLNRSASNATATTAPPPYGAAAGRLASPAGRAPNHAQHGSENPFADHSPVSPMEGSPFNDPPGTTPPISRNSSVYRSDRDDASTIGGASDAASIRQATLARNASIMSGGRVIDNVARHSQ